MFAGLFQGYYSNEIPVAAIQLRCSPVLTALTVVALTHIEMIICTVGGDVGRGRVADSKRSVNK
jgi:hypothetical protein